MTDLWTAFYIGMSIGGLCVFGIFAGVQIFMHRTRPKTLKGILDKLYLEMLVGDQRTLNITIKREKRKIALVSYRLVSDLYDKEK